MEIENAKFLTARMIRKYLPGHAVEILPLEVFKSKWDVFLVFISKLDVFLVFKSNMDVFSKDAVYFSCK